MALSFCQHYSPYYNILPIYSINNRYANIPPRAYIESSGFSTPISRAFSYDSISGPALIPVPNQIPTINKYSDKNL